jgi:hypothetical protein
VIAHDVVWSDFAVARLEQAEDGIGEDAHRDEPEQPRAVTVVSQFLQGTVETDRFACGL